MDCKHPNIKSGYEAPYELAWCTHCGYITWCGDGLIPQGAEKSTDYTDWVRAHVRAWSCNAEAAGRGLCERWCGHYGCPAVLVGTTQVPDLAAQPVAPPKRIHKDPVHAFSEGFQSGKAFKDYGWLEGKAGPLPETGWDGHASDCATHNDPAYPNGECDCGAEASEVRLQKPDWTAACEAMRWLNEVEIAQGGTNGPTIKLRAALAALAARVARLEGLLSRAQPSHSHSIKCRDSNSDENCLRCAIDAARKEGT